MKILDIYKRYHIIKNLEEHQFRVAAVASLICDNFEGEINKKDIVTACLLHDMGNILKFPVESDAYFFKENLRELGMEHWIKIKEWVRVAYGAEEHEATINMVKEIGVSDRVSELVDSVGFLQGIKNVSSSDIGKKICTYSDMRVNPWGIVSLEERLNDLSKRYQGKRAQTLPEKIIQFENALRTIEQQIFSKVSISPADINNESAKPVVDVLQNFNI